MITSSISQPASIILLCWIANLLKEYDHALISSPLPTKTSFLTGGRVVGFIYTTLYNIVANFGKLGIDYIKQYKLLTNVIIFRCKSTEE